MPTIHLVYDAPAGWSAAVIDSAKKALGLDACPLCAITHGLVAERRAWKRCKESLRIPVQAWHSDDMPRDVRQAVAGHLPAVVAEVDGKLTVLPGRET